MVDSKRVKSILEAASSSLAQVRLMLRSGDPQTVKGLYDLWELREQVAQRAHEVSEANAEYRKKNVREV